MIQLDIREEDLENGEKVNFHSVEVIGERVSFIKT